MLLKKWKCAAAGLLAGVLFLSMAGCKSTVEMGENENISSTEEGEAAKGRYIETQKQTPEGLSTITDMTRLSDGSIAIIDLNTGKLHISPDNGDSWSQKELPVLAEKIAEQAEITSSAVAPDGGVFFSYVNWGEDANAESAAEADSEESQMHVVTDDDSTKEPIVEEHYVYIDAAGTAEELSWGKTITDSVLYLSKAAFTEEKTLVVRGLAGEVCRISLEEETVEQILKDQIVVDFEKIVFADGYLLSEKTLYRFSDKETIEDSILSEFIEQETNMNIRFCVDEEENILYAAAASGLYSHVIGGSMMEKLLDGGLSNLGDPTKTAVALLRNEDGSFLIAYEDGEIDQYTYDKDAPSVPSQQLTVYSLKQNTTVSKAISMFRKNHPDIYVKQEIGMSGDYGLTEEDAIKNLNTRLLAGEGPDILVLDGMPVDSYIEKHVLADLKDAADGLEEKNAYFSNILRAYQTENGLYAIPIRYEIPILVGEKEEIEGISNLTELTERIQKVRKEHPNSKTLLGTYTAEELLRRLYMTSSPALIQEHQLDGNAVREFLIQAEAVYQEEQKNITEEMVQQYEETQIWYTENGLSEVANALGINSSCAFGIVGGEQILAAGTLSSMEDFQMLNGILATKAGTDFELLPGLSGQVFSPNGIVGINEESREKELSVSFLEELLGPEVQQSDLEDGFPVNADAYDTFTKNKNPDAVMGFVASTVDEDTGKETRVEFIAEWPDEEKILALKEQIGTLNTPTVSDEMITAAVIETGIKVLEGTLTIDEGCDEVVQKVELYLAE